MRFVGKPAQRRDVGAGLLKLGLGELRFAREIVQMAHGRGHDFAAARVRGPIQLSENGPGHVALVADDHLRTPAERSGGVVPIFSKEVPIMPEASPDRNLTFGR